MINKVNQILHFSYPITIFMTVLVAWSKVGLGSGLVSNRDHLWNSEGPSVVGWPFVSSSCSRKSLLGRHPNMCAAENAIGTERSKFENYHDSKLWKHENSELWSQSTTN